MFSCHRGWRFADLSARILNVLRLEGRSQSRTAFGIWCRVVPRASGAVLGRRGVVEVLAHRTESTNAARILGSGVCHALFSEP